MSFGVALPVDNLVRLWITHMDTPSLRRFSAERKAPPLGGLRPRRLAVFGHPGSLRDPPTRHPHNEPASPTRFLFRICGNHHAPTASTPTKPNRCKWLSKKARRIWGASSRGQARPKRRRRGDSGPLGVFPACHEELAPAQVAALYGLPSGRFSRGEILDLRGITHRPADRER